MAYPTGNLLSQGYVSHVKIKHLVYERGIIMESKAIQKYEHQGVELIEQAESIMIVDDVTRELATEFSSNTRAAIKAIGAEFRPDIDKAHQLHKALCDRLKNLRKPFEQAQLIVDGELKRDYLERKRIRREEERQANIKAEAERIRQEEEQRQEAEQLIEDGKLEEAEAVLDAAVVTAPIVPVAKVDKTSKSNAGSITARTDIRVELVDKMVVLTGVFDGKLPRTLVDVNMGAAKRYAEASGLKEMPGFRITEDAVISGRVR